MTKKFIIKDVWLLYENGNKKVKLTTLDINAIETQVKEENIIGGYGNIKEINKTKL